MFEKRFYFVVASIILLNTVMDLFGFNTNQKTMYVTGQPDFTASYASIGNKELDNPLTVSVSNGRMFVSDYNNNRVLIYNQIPNTNYYSADVVVGQTEFYYKTSGTSDTKLSGPAYAYSDGTRLFIADNNNNRVLIYITIPSTNGAKADTVIGQPNFTSSTVNNGGISAKSLYRPYYITTLDTMLFIADYNNHRVLIYNTIPDTNFAPANVVIGQKSLDTNVAPPVVGDTTIYFPTSVSVASGKVFIADRGTNRVLMYDTIPQTNGISANLIFGQPDSVASAANNGGLTRTSLNQPTGCHFDGTKLYIADNVNNRVKIYNSLPAKNNAPADIVLGQATFYTNGASTSQTGMSSPYSVFYNNAKLFVCDKTNNRILIFYEPPFNPSITINSGDTYAKSTSVSLSLQCDGYPAEMIISNDGTFDIEVWENYATARTWTLTEGNDTKTVCVKFKDNSGSESPIGYDTIILNTSLINVFNVNQLDKEIYYEDNLIKIKFPENTFDTFCSFYISVPELITLPPPPSNAKRIGSNMAREIKFIGNAPQVKNNIQIVIPYSDTYLVGIKEKNLRIFYYNETKSQWELETSSLPDIYRNYVSAEINHLSVFEVMELLPSYSDYVINSYNTFIYPNPAESTNFVYFRISANENALIKIKTFNIAGECINQIDDVFYAGQTYKDIGLNIFNYASGIYIALIEGTGEDSKKNTKLIYKFAIIK